MNEKIIIPVSTLAQAASYIDGDTWLFLDIDNTLLEATQYWGHIDCFDAQRAHLEQKGMTPDEVSDHMRDHWIDAQMRCPVRSMEPETHLWIRRFQEESAHVVGLTHRYTEPRLVDCTLAQLKNIGIDLSWKAPKSTPTPVSIQPLRAPAHYQSGIIFAGDNDKGPALNAFFKTLAIAEPKRLVFIEDKLENVQSLQTHVSCQYVGLHYNCRPRGAGAP